jgi:UDP-N-acetyl-D-mannosaminuronate dehydrogenase
LSDRTVIVIGLGEVGKPLLRILGKCYPCVGVDLQPCEVDRDCDVLHICYPFHGIEFVTTTTEYISKYRPTVVVVNSTVPPGTTRQIQRAVGDIPVVYSPVRGKHSKMEADMLHYAKFVGGLDTLAIRRVVEHFERAGFRCQLFRTPEIAELSKLLETSWLGILVAWAQEVERFAKRYGAAYEEVNAFIKEIDFLPSHIVPGYIGGHCVMPNIAILQRHFTSELLDAVVHSNIAKQADMAAQHTPEVLSR